MRANRASPAAGRGERQAVVLGAGLDTLGLRNTFQGTARLGGRPPATQEWKRDLGPVEIAARFFGGAITVPGRGDGPHVVRARREV